MSVAVEDIATELGRTAQDGEYDQWNLWISDAELLIEARLGPLAELDQRNLAYVIRQAVVAQIKRPDDATTVDMSVDDGRVAKTYRSSAGRVTIRDEWWDLLSPTNGGRGAFSIRPSGSTVAHLPWCASMFGAAYCSCGADIAGRPIFEGSVDW